VPKISPKPGRRCPMKKIKVTKVENLKLTGKCGKPTC
jgi:hypothetical protein